MIKNIIRLIGISLLLIFLFNYANAQKYTIKWRIKGNDLFLNVKPKIGGVNPIPPPQPIEPEKLKSIKEYIKNHKFKIIKKKEEFFLKITTKNKKKTVVFNKQFSKTGNGYVLPKEVFKSEINRKDNNFLQVTKNIFEDRIFPLK